MPINPDGSVTRRRNWSAAARRGEPLDPAAIDAEIDELADLIGELAKKQMVLHDYVMRGGGSGGAPLVLPSAPAAVPHDVINRAVQSAVAAAVAPLRTEMVAQSRAPAAVVSAASGPDPATVARVEALERALAAVSRAAPPPAAVDARIAAVETALRAAPSAAAPAAVNLTPITDRLTALERGLATAAAASLEIARDVIVRQRLLLEARAALDDADPDGSNYPLLEVYAGGQRIHDAAEALFAAQAAWSELAAASSDPEEVVKAWREAV